MVETLLDLTPEGEIGPKLAEKWEVSPCVTVFTLTLRRGIRFHDGEPLNAEAVKVNFERRLDPKAATPMRFLVAPIKSVTVVDEYTVRMETTKPFAAMLGNLTHTTNSIQSPAALKASWDKPLPKPVGTGPFIMKERIPGDRVTMVRNENYWGEKAKLDEVVWRVIPDDAARMVALEAGEVHVAVRVPPLDIPRLEADPEIYVDHTSSIRTIYIGFNTLVEPFDDIRVRQALNYAVNKEAIVKYVLGGVGRVSDAPISPGIFGYHPIMTYEYNPEKAKALLAEAGYPDGFEIAMHFSPGRYYMDAPVVTAAVADLLKVGVKVEIITMEWGTFLPFIIRPAAEAEHKMFLLGWGCITGDADYGLFPLFRSEERFNLAFYKNERVDELLTLGRTTADPEVRKSAYKEAMAIIMDEAPWLFLHSESQATGIRANVKDLWVHPTERVMAHTAWIGR
jgi:peptide/nickel transport system substrate-binding protein